MPKDKNTPIFEKQLKRDDTIDNEVTEIKLLQARYKDFHMKVKEIDEPVLNKIENLNNDNNTKSLIKECNQRNYQNEEIKSIDIYNNKLHKLKKRYYNKRQNENDQFFEY